MQPEGVEYTTILLEFLAGGSHDVFYFVTINSALFSSARTVCLSA
uniref:Uncharacterized protein n=1 Tax=Anguilla anguilla TaxID=7936 RepID=A0A0E9R1Z4_ANGAN